MRGTTYAITPYDSHSHPWMAHAVNRKSKQQITRCQVQVIVLRSIAHEKLGWYRQVMEWCEHRRMLRCGKPFKVKLQHKLSVVDKAAFIGINETQRIKQRSADRTTTHR